MKNKLKDLGQKIQSLGLRVIEKTKEGIQKAKESIENTLLEDNLRRRFNLENPYKFQMVTSEPFKKVIEEWLPRHAKRYDEDDVFVFYGSMERNGFQAGEVLRDLSSDTDYRIKSVMEVYIPVTYEGKSIDVIATAVDCELL
ncbi:MAG: hypothetical protein WCR28_06675 [Candidatus Izemoplasmatales bacterium]|jgi:hypothetical protein|nr:hypothetical protein [Candidatus Izemoplasmatales bacterium]MDD4987757.1 hypothetical protein [Candidatus Izemoplasmatales bacterium]MDY0372820.1 hypothetical protein [Candidatus Izemoplasmatales bacterium]